MLKFYDVNYDQSVNLLFNDLYKLRKKTFKDRLKWNVDCSEELEIDQYDNHNTRYIFGTYNEQIVCSIRFIGLNLPNMITHTFREQFADVTLPADKLESSRFFVDKNRSRNLLGTQFPLTLIFFIAIVNYVRQVKQQGFYTIVSHPMTKIIQRSGWKLKQISTANLSEKEKIYLLYLPTDDETLYQLTDQVVKHDQLTVKELTTWPMNLMINPSQI